MLFLCSWKIINIMPTVSTAMLQSSLGKKKAKLQVYSSYIVSSTVGVSDALGGVVDVTRRFLLRVGVGLLTAGGGPSGGFGLIGTGDVAVSVRLTLGNGLMSLGHGSLGGRGSSVGCFF